MGNYELALGSFDFKSIQERGGSMSVQHIPTYVKTIRSLGKHIPKSSNLSIVLLGRICFCAATSLTEQPDA